MRALQDLEIVAQLQADQRDTIENLDLEEASSEKKQ